VRVHGQPVWASAAAATAATAATGRQWQPVWASAAAASAATDNTATTGLGRLLSKWPPTCSGRELGPSLTERCVCAEHANQNGVPKRKRDEPTRSISRVCQWQILRYRRWREVYRRFFSTAAANANARSMRPINLAENAGRQLDTGAGQLCEQPASDVILRIGFAKYGSRSNDHVRKRAMVRQRVEGRV